MQVSYESHFQVSPSSFYPRMVGVRYIHNLFYLIKLFNKNTFSSEF